MLAWLPVHNSTEQITGKISCRVICIFAFFAVLTATQNRLHRIRKKNLWNPIPDYRKHFAICNLESRFQEIFPVVYFFHHCKEGGKRDTEHTEQKLISLRDTLVFRVNYNTDPTYVNYQKASRAILRTIRFIAEKLS